MSVFIGIDLEREESFYFGNSAHNTVMLKVAIAFFPLNKRVRDLE